MLEGYKPIDFSSVLPPMQLGQMRNRVGLSEAAQNILASSSFSNTPISTLLSHGLDSSGNAPKRKQTLWGRAIDLLSTPAYAIANAADDALAGHQSDDFDSVLEDALQIAGGVVTGAGRGIGTGLRGAFAPSETAADPQDKIYLGDALIRYDTHMSAEDAMNPENLEEVRGRLANKKINMLSDADEDKYFYDHGTGRVEVSDDDIKQYFKDMNLYGLGASMVADPLNFVTGGSKVAQATKGAKGSSEVFEMPKVNTGMPRVIDSTALSGSKRPTSFRVNLPPGAIQNKIATPSGLIKPPDWFDFPVNADAMTATRGTVPGASVANEIDPFETIINRPATGEAFKTELPKAKETTLPVARIPDAQSRIAHKYSQPDEIVKFSGDLLRRMSSGDYANALERISVKHPTVEMAQTVKFITHLQDTLGANITNLLKIPDKRKKLVNALNRVIHADAQSLAVPQRVTPAAEILNKVSEFGPIGLNQLVQGAKGRAPVVSKNPARDTKIIDEVVKQFEPQLSLKTIPAGIKDAAKYKTAMASHGAYTGPKQVNVWNSLTSKHLVNAKTPGRFKKALDLLKQIEQRFEGMGHMPMSSTPKAGDSRVLKLSQVLETIGPSAAAMNPTLLTKILRGDYSSLPVEVAQKLEAIKAGEAIVDGQKMVQGIETTSKTIEDLIKSGPLSAARTEQIVTIGSKVADDIARSAGGSSVAGSKAAEYIKATMIPKAPGDKFPVTNTIALLSNPTVSTKAYKNFTNANKVSKDIHESIGGPTPRQLGKLFGPAAGAIEWLGARFNAAYRNSDMRPGYLRNAATAKSTVALRAQYLNNLAKKYNINDADLWNDALKGAQGRQAPIPGSQAEALSKELQEIMENLFSSSGLKATIALENSVVGRSQLLMSELNSNLKRFGLGDYQFTKGKKAKKGEAVNPYWEGTNWLNSWEAWKIEKPLEFMFKVQNVVEHTVREKIMFDEIIARFGAPKAIGDYKTTVNHPRLQGYYFGKEAASQANQFVQMLKEVSTPNSKSMQHFDKVLSKWKAGVTIYVPSHHIRNIIGDVYFNWLGGVNSLRPYSSAMSVMRSQKGRYEGLEAISQLSNPNALKQVIAGKGYSAAGKQTALTMKNGTNVTNDMVYVSAFQQGILPTTRVLEDIPDDAITGLEKFKPLGGKGQKAAHTVSEGRDHYVRLAHYIDVLKKSNKPFEQAVEEAAAVVRKWHPDGMDLTKFERNVMRRMFPFYSWTRKAFPLILESMVATPGKVMAYPKGQYLLQNMMGMETGPMSDPFPYDQLFPDWMREKGIGPIMGEPGSYSVVNPGNPSMDLIAGLNHPGKMSLGLLNPAARIPIELATGADAQTGAPIEMTDTDYWAKQIPGVSHAGRATGEFGVSDTTKENSSGVNFQNILNMLTAAGYQNTGPYQRSAEFDLREYIRSLNGR